MSGKSLTRQYQEPRAVKSLAGLGNKLLDVSEWSAYALAVVTFVHLFVYGWLNLIDMHGGINAATCRVPKGINPATFDPNNYGYDGTDLPNSVNNWWNNYSDRQVACQNWAARGFWHFMSLAPSLWIVIIGVLVLSLLGALGCFLLRRQVVNRSRQHHDAAVSDAEQQLRGTQFLLTSEVTKRKGRFQFYYTDLAMTTEPRYASVLRASWVESAGDGTVQFPQRTLNGQGDEVIIYSQRCPRDVQPRVEQLPVIDRLRGVVMGLSFNR